MIYASQADITDLYGERVLYVADRDGDGVPDVPAIERALLEASAEIDSYLATRYALPLPDGTDVSVLRKLAVDIAVYTLALSRDVLTDEITKRYENAVASLRRLAKGEQTLQLPADPDTDPEDPHADGPRAIVQGGPERLFSREKMRDF